MTNINIKLESNSDGNFVFYPNQIIRGAVELSLDQRRKIKAFYIKITGIAKCHWTESETREVGTGDDRRTESVTIHFDGKEHYLNSKTYLIGHEGADAAEIPAGLHTYTFACELPPLIPESLIGPLGDISYNVEAVLDIPWRFDKEIKTPFTVARYDNLNSYPELLMPLKLEEIKTFCCLFCQSAPCMMTASIPCGGFSLGKAILIRLEYVNRSSTNVEQTKFKLIRTFLFRSSTPHSKTNTSSELIVETIDGGVAKGKSANIETAVIIPSVLNHSNGRYCSVVEVAYFLEIEGVVRGCHSNLKLSFPIQLGAIGVGEGASSNYNQAFPQQPLPMPTAPLVDLPPTFEEATGIKHSEVDASLVNPNLTLGWKMPSAPQLPQKY